MLGNFKKRILSAVMAGCMLFGSAAMLPENCFVQQTQISAGAETWNGFEYELDYNHKIKLTAYKGKKKDITIPKTIGGIEVHHIDQAVFEGNKTIENVVIECDLDYIIHYMFKDCTSLKSVKFMGLADYSYHNVFENCTSLESVKLPDDLTSIPGSMFLGCSNLSEIEMSDDMKNIGGRALDGTKWLANMQKKNPLVVYKNMLVDASIYKKANFTVPSNIKSICGSAFYGNKSLISIVVPQTVEYIGADAFEYCENLQKAVINVSKQKLMNGLFRHCSSLTDVTICEGVEQLWNFMFAWCTSLKKIKLPSTVKDVGFSCFDGCTSLEDVDLPYGVTDIGYYCFYGCENLKKLWIPDTVKRIGSQAFYRCFPEPLIIPAGVEKINEKAFGYYSTGRIDTEFVLTGYKGSLAEKYAKEYGLKFKTITKCPHVAGEKKKVAATCTEAGYDGKACRICNKLMSGKQIKALGHKWTETEYNWYGLGCTAKRTCTRDNCLHIETEGAVITSKKKSDPTCTQWGVTTYTARFVNPDFKTQVRDLWDIPMTGHKWSDWKTTAYDFAAKTSTQTRKCSACGKTETQTTTNAIERLAGANRYETASVISTKMYPKTSDTVIIATGLTFHDAMVAVPLASAYDAPLLLAIEKHITAQTEAELKRLKAKNVIVISTNGAIGSGAKAELKALGLKATYIEGKNVFETSTKVAKALQTQNKKAPDTIFFATDGAFADALSASPVAAVKNAPIIYLKNTGSIDKTVADYLKSVKGKVKNAYVIGGNGVISDAMMKKAASALGLTVNKTVQRVAGANRYETCVAVNNQFKSVLSSDGICVAKGLDFPDALAGGVYAAATKQALFLADGKKLLDCQNTYLKGKNAAKITVFGGTGAVPDELVKLIAKASM